MFNIVITIVGVVFSRSVFERLVLQTCKNQGLFGKGLMFNIVITIVRVENIVKKRMSEKCRLQQCLLGLQTKVFSMGSVVKVNPFPNKPWILRVCSKSLFKTVGQGKNACDKQFLLFHQHFLTFYLEFLSFSSNLKLWSANSFSLVFTCLQ